MGDWILGLSTDGEVPSALATRMAAHATGILGPGPTSWAVAEAAQIAQELTVTSAAEGWDLTGHEAAALEAALLTLMCGLVAGEPFATPAETVEQVRWAARQGMSAENLLRIIWHAHTRVQRALLRAMTEQVEPQLLADVISPVSEGLLDFVGGLTGHLTTVFKEESEAWGRHRSASIRRALDDLVARGDQKDDTEQVLGLRLTDHHLALMVWPVTATQSPGWSPTLARWLEGVTPLLGARNKIVVPRTDGSTEAIWSGPEAPAPEALAKLRQIPPPAGTAVAVGFPAPGRGGLADSVQAARQLHHMARNDARSRLWWYDSDGLTSLLLADVPRARTWVRRQLQGLLELDERSATLRRTLRVFLEQGGSRSASAALLHVAPTTIAYRVTQTTRLLERPLEGRHLEVLSALVLADDFPREVLDT
ncbi:MAG: helix-turn-helix domain-containing protein [Propionibacteriaceae bacterium]|nr:helix-turn-helix domain-containing protein [Propionibacteriaceae bacterium]